MSPYSRIIVSFLLATTASVVCPGAPPPEQAGAPESVWTEYLRQPDTHPNLPNVSYAGYHYGEKPIPNIEGPVYNVRKYGAIGDGETDDSRAIRAALEAVSPEVGGVVYFPSGRYRVDGVLFVHTNNTVLRGEDRHATEIVFTRPLDEAYGPSRMSNEGRSSRWSWQGGHIWFTPRSSNTWRIDNSPLKQGSPEHWKTRSPIGVVSKEAHRGDNSITLDRFPGEDGIRSGDFILITIPQPDDISLLRHLAGDGPWAGAYDWRQDNSSGFPRRLPQSLRWPVEVTAIDAVTRTLTLRQPLRFDIRPAWGATVALLDDTIRESGIENLTLRFLRDYNWDWPIHNIEPAWNGPWFNQAIHCWLRDLTLIDAGNGPGVAAAKCVTFTRFSLLASSPERERHHHGTTCRAASADCLFEDFEIFSHPIHGINVEQFSSGNVWSRGRMAHGTFDTHRNMPFENVRTQIVVNNDGRHGGTGGPVMGARFVHWNIEVTNREPYVIAWAGHMPDGAIVGLRGVAPIWNARSKLVPTGKVSGVRIEAPERIPVPANLYEAQLKLRLASD